MLAVAGQGQREMHDIVTGGGTIVDGTGSPACTGDKAGR
jgi:hypothetical protein